MYCCGFPQTNGKNAFRVRIQSACMPAFWSSAKLTHYGDHVMGSESLFLTDIYDSVHSLFLTVKSLVHGVYDRLAGFVQRSFYGAAGSVHMTASAES